MCQKIPLPCLGFGKQYNILNEKERFTAQLSASQSPNHTDLKYTADKYKF